MSEEIKSGDAGSSPGAQAEVGTAAPAAVEAPKGSGSTAGVGEALEPRGAGDAGAGSSPAGTPAPKDGEWPKSAIDQVTKARARYREAEERQAKLTARLREYEARGAGAPAPINPQTGVQYTAEQIEAMIEERATLKAQTKAAEIAFTSRCNAVAQKGASQFPDWKPRLTALTSMVDNQQKYNLFLEAALETGEAETIIHTLGGDPERAMRLLALEPLQMATEVGRMAARPQAEPSRLPRPIRPVGSSSPSTAARPDDPERGAEGRMEDWVKAREAQLAEKRRR